MNLKKLFQDFNHSKCFVALCLLLFSLLFALRLDSTIQWSYWVVFIPVWLWKLMVIGGCGVGIYVWVRNPDYRTEVDSFIQFKAMIISTAMQSFLLIFELLVCDKLETDRELWIFVFTPLMFMSVVAFGICIWALKHERSFELELFCSVNILQFIFFALRLDALVSWSWVVVFIPLWIVMFLSLIGVLYAIILAIILLKSPDIIPEQRRSNAYRAVGYTTLAVPLLIFEILLANRLDGDNQYLFIAITLPLFVSLITLSCMSFGSKGGNQWWFGLRTDFCQFLLGVCPLLQEYGNISYKLHHNDDSEAQRRQSADETSRSGEVKKSDSSHSKFCVEDEPRPVVPKLFIESPD